MTLASLSAAELADVARELDAEVAGHSLGRVFDADHGLLLELGRVHLLLSVHPRASRAHLATKPRAAAQPSGFAMLLRKRLGGLRVESITALPGERTLELSFGAGRDRLIAELTGPHGNVFLVGADGVVVAILRRSGSTTRTLGPGVRYTPPEPTAAAAWKSTHRFGPEPGILGRVAAHYETAITEATRVEQLARAAVALRRDVEKLSRRANALRGDLAKADAAQAFRKLGDLLLAHLYELPPRGATSVTLPDDFEDGTPLTIVLDPTMDGRQNAARYYKQHKRLAAGRTKIVARLDETTRALAAREQQSLALATLPEAQLAALAAKAPAPQKQARARKAEPEERLPYRAFTTAGGLAIWVGRSAADNDTLTFRHARGADLWLHTRDAPGAHVIIPLRGGAKLTDAALVDAATLAAHYSPLAKEAQVDIQYTAVKNVRKAKGMAPGAVFTSDTKTIRVRLEPDRVRRLLAGDAAD